MAAMNTFCHCLCATVVRPGASQWIEVVRLMRDQPTRLSYRGRWQKVATSKEIGSVAKLLIEIEIAIVRDTSACERWFSLMNRLKDKRRNRLNTGILDDLMFICLHAPRNLDQLKAMCPQILNLWSESTDRYKKSGPNGSRWLK